MQNFTPMMQQYLQIKKQYQDALLLFRLGDFYELFFEDAVTASRILGITLTGRDAGGEERVPMCGVPYHALDNYLVTLVEHGYKVAICEQMEEPGQGKGIVRREVVRVVTPGTLLEEKGLDAKANHYIACLVQESARFGLAACDLSTGEMMVSEYDSSQSLFEETARLEPRELVVVRGSEEMAALAGEVKAVVSVVEAKVPEALGSQFEGKSLAELGLESYPAACCAAGTLLHYLRETQKRPLSHVKPPVFLQVGAHLVVDAYARRNLELVETIREKQRRGSLLWLLDQTKTAMGGRLLRKWIERPLAQRTAIESRLDAVEALVNHFLVRQELRELLDGMYDLERLVGRVAYGTANARDLLAIKTSLSLFPRIKEILDPLDCSLLRQLSRRIRILDGLVALLEAGIADHPPVTLKEGGLIKEGYHAELDRLRQVSRSGKEWMAALEQKERERTGIKSLKVGYNRVFGYYIEVTKANAALVPPDYERKQTLANAERYITPALKEREAEILGATDRSMELEYQLFLEIRQAVCDALGPIQETAEAVASVDVLQALATVSQERGYVRPVILENDCLRIENGRHPVIEAVLPPGQFVPNSVELNSTDRQVCLVTGPNMGGKSTFMRQTALIVLMAQMGMFVPATSAEIGLVDRLFTRIGAADDLVAGQSTFMVEMVELANILRNATRRSLIILDEIGRGTSTLDGISIAQAALEYIHHRPGIGARTLFATHYHELTKLAALYPGIQNYSSAVEEQDDQVVFLHQMVPRAADRSYGIHVARLAGLPETVLERAREILALLEQQNVGVQQTAAAVESKAPTEENAQLVLPLHVEPARAKKPVAAYESSWNDHPVLARIRRLNLLEITPLQAMQLLYEFQKEVLGNRR
jgi:DNA mismatch repair protein MutS